MSPRINFDEIEEPEAGDGDFGLLPDGEYPVMVNEVHVREREDGSESWGLELKVVDGEFKGRRIFDNLFFTPKALGRVKLVLSRLGLETTGEVEVTPEVLLERTATVIVTTETYQGKTRNKIPFDGWRQDEPSVIAAPAKKGPAVRSAAAATAKRTTTTATRASKDAIPF